MDNLKEALEYLVGLGETKIIDVGVQSYSTNKLFKVEIPKPEPLQVTTLTALIDYIESNFDIKFDRNATKLLIHVISPDQVNLYSPLLDTQDRMGYMQCKALLNNNIKFNRFVDTEDFNIMLQSSFVENSDRSLLLKVTGNIQEDNVRQTGDDGISQAVTVKTGLANVDNVKVPNPVVLAPFRTFPEIQQPESKFIFRMQSGPTAALFEADGGAWRNEAMQRIKRYLIEELEIDEKSDISIIS